MRTRMNYTPGFGASPEPVMEHDLDGLTARHMLAAVDRIRGLTAEFAAKVAAEIGANDLWFEDGARASAEHLRALIEELIDEQLHQGKLEEAGEIV